MPLLRSQNVYALSGQKKNNAALSFTQEAVHHCDATEFSKCAIYNFDSFFFSIINLNYIFLFAFYFFSTNPCYDSLHILILRFIPFPYLNVPQRQQNGLTIS